MDNRNAIIEDTWLVSIPALKNQTKESTIDYIFASTSLRFDSHVFAYCFDNAGKEYSTKFSLLYCIKTYKNSDDLSHSMRLKNMLYIFFRE